MKNTQWPKVEPEVGGIFYCIPLIIGLNLHRRAKNGLFYFLQKPILQMTMIIISRISLYNNYCFSIQCTDKIIIKLHSKLFPFN